MATSGSVAAAAAARRPSMPTHELMGESEAVLVVSLHSIANAFAKRPEQQPVPFYCVVKCGDDEVVTAEGTSTSLQEHFVFSVSPENQHGLAVYVVFVEEQRDRVLGKVEMDVPVIVTDNLCLRDHDNLPLVRCRDGEEKRVNALRDRAERPCRCDGHDASYAKLQISATVLTLPSVPGIVKDSLEAATRAKAVTAMLEKLVPDRNMLMQARSKTTAGSEAAKELHYAFFLAEQLSMSGVRAGKPVVLAYDRETIALIPNETPADAGAEGGVAGLKQTQMVLRGLQFFFAVLGIAITSALDEINMPTVDFCTFYRDSSNCPIPDCDLVKGEYDYEFYWLVIITGAMVCCYTLVLFASMLRPALFARACSPLLQLASDVVLTFVTFFASLASAAVVEVSEKIEFPVSGITTKAYFTLNSLYETFEDCMYENPVPMIRGGIAMLFLTCFALAISIPISYNAYRTSCNLSMPGASHP